MQIGFDNVFPRCRLDRSQFAFVRSHLDRFRLRSISDEINLIHMAKRPQIKEYCAFACTIIMLFTYLRRSSH